MRLDNTIVKTPCGKVTLEATWGEAQERHIDGYAVGSIL